ncbi:MAG TPA: hypothetical protein VF618_15020 [Thermoanaerobaculia bacterium]
MKKLLAVVAVLLALWLTVTMLSLRAEQEALHAPWPAGLGTLAEVPKRFPPREATPAARQLVPLASDAGVDLAPAIRKPGARDVELRDYVRAQLQRDDGRVETPPAPVVDQLTMRGPALDAIRAHLFAGQPVAWKFALGSEELPNLSGHMHLTRLFIARALATQSWDDLHAAWELNRDLRSRPEVISQLIALANTRQINGAARSLPLPEPAWMNELRTFDHRRAMLVAHQAEAWSFGRAGKRSPLLVPHHSFSIANGRDAYRLASEQVAAAPNCVVDAALFGEALKANLARWNGRSRTFMPNTTAIWSRIGRARLEIEGTQKLAMLKSGRTEGVESSACAEGKWVVDGRVLRYSKEVPTIGNVETRIPLSMRY